MLPTADLLLDVSPKAVAYLLVPPPQSLPKLQHYIPIFGLVILPKWRPRYMGFYAARLPHRRLQSNVT